MDAKYKRSEDLQRYDRFQMITYIHIRRAKLGLLLYPDNNSLSEMRIEYEDGQQGKLNGDGFLGFVSFAVPKDATGFPEFQAAIRKSEARLNELIAEKL